MTEELPSQTRIEHLFERRASDRGEMPAVSTAESACDYRQLRARSRQVADLVSAAVPAGGEPIGLLLPNGAALVEGALGVWYSGNVVVPISTNYASESIERVVATLGLRTILTGCHDKEGFAGLASNLVLHDGATWSSEKGQGDAPRRLIPTTADHAAVFLTSGTTGNPKIVALTHKNILFNLASLEKAIPLGDTDKSFVCVPLCHSYGFTLQMLGTLCAGRELYIGRGHRISSELARELCSSRCTSFFGVPTAYRMVLDGIGRCRYREELRHVRVLVNGASSMTPEVMLGLRKRLPWASLYLTYGLSEASPLVTVLPPEWADRKLCSIGRAVDGVELKLESDDGEITTLPGRVGEILIKGESVIEGYLGNEEANALSFCEGYLRTGDVAMIDEDGCLYFKGRRKDLINRGGEKIYPEDVEAVLQSHGSVMHSAVVACPHPILGEVPFAFVVPREGCRCEPSQLRQWCMRFLSPQQMPVGVEIVDSLPRTATGKIRKNELAEVLARRQARCGCEAGGMQGTHD